MAEQESSRRHEARVVVALREKGSGRVWVGEPWEQHPDVRRRCGLGARTAGWLVDGFVDRDTGEFLTRGQASRRWPQEAGRTFGRGTADSSDFAAIRRAKLERWGRRDRSQHGAGRRLSLSTCARGSSAE